MINKTEIDAMILSSIKEVLEDHKSITLETFFIGAESSISSLDIVQIIASVEEKMEDAGLEGYDIFEKTFENKCLTFSDFADLLERELRS